MAKEETCSLHLAAGQLDMGPDAHSVWSMSAQSLRVRPPGTEWTHGLCSNGSAGGTRAESTEWSGRHSRSRAHTHTRTHARAGTHVGEREHSRRKGMIQKEARHPGRDEEQEKGQ